MSDEESEEEEEDEVFESLPVYKPSKELDVDFRLDAKTKRMYLPGDFYLSVE